MADLTKGEQILYAKYWGKKDLFNNPRFWSDVFNYYKDTEEELALPVIYDPLQIRKLQDMLHCPPGECARCCHYHKVHVGLADIDRIVENTEYGKEQIEGMLEEDERGKYLSCKDGCPFLKDKMCSIYPYRPDTCWLFPLQVGRDVLIDGKLAQQVMIRIVCAPALQVARQVIGQALQLGGRMLLPDLSVIPVYKEENEASNNNAVKTINS